MCEWGNTATVVTNKQQRVQVDSCIAPLVAALNDGGISTLASCCGHGKGFGNIVLGDFRELFIIPDHKTARSVEKNILKSRRRLSDD